MKTKIEGKHTPGPWLVMGNNRNGHFDYVLPMSNNTEFQANCRLIAAAPELLELAKSIVLINSQTYLCKTISELAPYLKNLSIESCGLIAKVEGR